MSIGHLDHVLIVYSSIQHSRILPTQPHMGRSLCGRIPYPRHVHCDSVAAFNI